MRDKALFVMDMPEECENVHYAILETTHVVHSKYLEKNILMKFQETELLTGVH